MHENLLSMLVGFPDTWFGYRKNIRAIASAGYRVIVPDQRGYGQSEVPRESNSYRMELLVEDNIALLDHLHAKSASKKNHLDIN